MNQFGKREYAACIRNREIIACPVGALALYLFYRWHRGEKGFADFTSRRHWYDTYLLKGKDGRHEIAYETQLDWVKQAFTGRRRYNQENARRPWPGRAGD